MLLRYIATFEFIEIVRGEPCEFVHETVVEAPDKDTALRIAQNEFARLNMQAGVGWTRVLNRCRVVSAPYEAVPVGAERAFAERTAAE